MYKKIAFVKPPFYRLAGSHSNKLPVELSYWQACAQMLGHETMLYHGDLTGAKKYIPWRSLMENTGMYKQLIDMKHDNPLLREVVEGVMSWGPDIVVISAYDAFMPSVACDSPFTAKYLAEMFKALGVQTIGVGAFFMNDPKLAEPIDVVLKNGPSQAGFREAVSVLESPILNFASGATIDAGPWQTDLQPLLWEVKPFPQVIDYSYVATTKGCNFPCKFCYNTITANRFEERGPREVLADLRDRHNVTRGKLDYYLVDQIFTRNIKRMRNFADLFKGYKFEFTVEARNELMNKGGEEMAKLMHQIGVRTAKMGVENTGDLFNKDMSKGQKEKDLRTATQLMRDAGISVVAYLFLGGSDDDGYKQTLEFCNDVDFDGYVVSMWSHPMDELGTDKYRYDAHWSLARKTDLNIPVWAIDEFLKLQESKGGNKSLLML